MTVKKLDRRVQRTRALLNNALMQLIPEKGYDHVTIEDITERANLGRTTFYLHYQSKDDLLLDHHAGFVTKMKLGVLSRTELLGDKPQPAMIQFLKQLSQSKAIYQAFTQAKDAQIIMRGVEEQGVRNLTMSLKTAFPELTPSPPIDALTRYIVGAQLSLIDWWIRSRASYSAQEIAKMLHQLRAVAIVDAFGVV